MIRAATDQRRQASLWPLRRNIGRVGERCVRCLRVLGVGHGRGLGSGHHLILRAGRSTLKGIVRTQPAPAAGVGGTGCFWGDDAPERCLRRSTGRLPSIDASLFEKPYKTALSTVAAKAATVPMMCDSIAARATRGFCDTMAVLITSWSWFR